MIYTQLWKNRMIYIYPIYFTPLYVYFAKVSSNTRIPNSKGWQRYSLQFTKKKRKMTIFYQEFRWNLIILMALEEECWRLNYCSAPRLLMVSQHREYGFCCLPRAHIEIHFYTIFEQITRWKRIVCSVRNTVTRIRKARL